MCVWMIKRPSGEGDGEHLGKKQETSFVFLKPISRGWYRDQFG